MSIQEAIETIKVARAEVEWNYPMDYAVAFDMAIYALQYWENIGKLHNCNDCSYGGYCLDEPRWGKPVRINCSGWKGKKAE